MWEAKLLKLQRGEWDRVICGDRESIAGGGDSAATLFSAGEKESKGPGAV